MSLADLRKREYELRTIVNRLQREVFRQSDPSTSKELLQDLADAEDDLRSAEKDRIAAQSEDPDSGQILDTAGGAEEAKVRGLTTTGLEAKVFLNMAHVPTSIYHLLDADTSPLITCTIKVGGEETIGGGSSKRRVRVTSYIEGYSAKAVSTVEIPSGKTFSLNFTFR
jgi:hypothetical protein